MIETANVYKKYLRAMVLLAVNGLPFRLLNKVNLFMSFGPKWSLGSPTFNKNDVPWRKSNER